MFIHSLDTYNWISCVLEAGKPEKSQALSLRNLLLPKTKILAIMIQHNAVITVLRRVIRDYRR